MAFSDLLKKHRLSESDGKALKRLFPRARPAELRLAAALAGALWSEHCSYKSSKKHLKKLFFKTQKQVSGLGENAGIADLGRNEKAAFKIESHNHPSHITPYHGAATGAGGVLRDIFTMGARPVFLANYLCFGLPETLAEKRRVDEAIRGVSGYGNAIGIPTLTGKTVFSRAYQGNTLVNAMALGLLEGDPVLSQPKGPGRLVIAAGAATGRDGIFGASMASEVFGEKSDLKSTVQIGDPFFGKLLMEKTLQAMRAGLVEAAQDMGAAGLAGASFEMAAKGGVGMELHLDKLPLRDRSMKPEEILISESQERMLFIALPQSLPALKAIFKGLEFVSIGKTIKGQALKLCFKKKLLLKTDPKVFLESAPIPDRPYIKSRPAARVLPEEISFKTEGLLKTLSSPEGRSREFVSSQYDSKVGAATVKSAPYPIGVFKLPRSGRLLGAAMGSRNFIMNCALEEGSLDAALFPALQLSLRGFAPHSLTDCLNFGNPERPEAMGEFALSVESLAKACKALDTPIVSGNVSFYNESHEGAITPAPVVAMIGLREKGRLPESGFSAPGSDVYLLSCRQLALAPQSLEAWPSGGAASRQGAPRQRGASRQATEALPRSAPRAAAPRAAAPLRSAPPRSAPLRPSQVFGAIQPELCAKFFDQLRLLSRFFESARAVGSFGLTFALAQMSLEKGVGFSLERHQKRPLWLYEAIAEVKNSKAFEKEALRLGARFERIGQSGGRELKTAQLKRPIERLRQAHSLGGRGLWP